MTYKVVLALLLLAPRFAEAQVERLVLGTGDNGWEDLAELMGGMWVVDSSLQPYELDPAVNIALGEKKGSSRTDVFGNIWGGERAGPHAARLILGQPEVLGDNGFQQTVDGDTTRSVAIVSGFYYYNLGWELPINRIRFFPPAEGRTQTDDRKRITPGLPLKNAYPKLYEVWAAIDGEHFKQGQFDLLLEQNLNQTTRIANARFPTQPLQFIFLNFPELGVIAEVEFYGEGFVQKSQYISKVIDIGEPVNFGQVTPYFNGFSKKSIDSDPELLAENPIAFSLETQTGRDHTPQIYTIYTELKTEREVSFAEWDKAPRDDYVRPRARGPKRPDVDNWSFWSVPQKASGGESIEILSPDNRQYLKINFAMESKDLFIYGRMDSLVVEYSPLLVDAVVGEVALKDEPQPLGRKTEVPLGEERIFTFDVRADFESETKLGFDALKLQTPGRVQFIGLEMGDPLAVVEPDSIAEKQGELIVYFPSNRIAAADNRPLRLLFKTGVFSFNALFQGEIFVVGGEGQPQSIDPGDANAAVSTNSIEVLALSEKLDVLSALDVRSAAVTPNGDGRNDTFELAYSLLGVQTSQVAFAIYDLRGRKVRTLSVGSRSEGRYVEEWDGRGEGTGRVAPGLYLARLSVETDAGDFTRTRIIAVAY